MRTIDGPFAPELVFERSHKLSRPPPKMERKEQYFEFCRDTTEECESGHNEKKNACEHSPTSCAGNSMSSLRVRNISSLPRLPH
jgi:hypothetical protein